MRDNTRNQITGCSNEAKKNRKQTKNKEIIIENERDVISTFFLRSLAFLRFMTAYEVELKAAIVEKASEEFEIKESSVNDHIDRVLELGFFTLEEDRKIYRNNKLYEWLWAYLLPFFPKKEREIIRWMLFGSSDEVSATMVARAKVYTQRIDDALREKFELDLGQKITDSLLQVIWGVFEGDFIYKNPPSTTAVRIKNEREVIGALFKKPMQALRIVFNYQADLKTTLVKKVMEEFEITRATARKHVNNILGSEILIIQENKIVCKNTKMVKWLWSYLIPFYPERERRALETMLFGISTKFDSKQLENIREYTKRIENAVRRGFAYKIDEDPLERIVSSIWGSFRSEKFKTDLL